MGDGPLAGQYLDRDIKSLEQKGDCGVGVEMKWVHLRINTRIRMLGCLGCIGAFARRTQQHAWGPVKNVLSTIYSYNWAADKNLRRLCRRAAHVVYTNGTQHEVCTVKTIEDARGRFKNTCSGTPFHYKCF